MKPHILILVALLAAASSISASAPATKSSDAPASVASRPTPTLKRLAALVGDNDLRLAFNNHDKAAAFNQDRTELGPDLEKAIANFVGRSPQRHYWIACYLTETDYRGSNTPDYKMALALLEEGIVLNDADKEALPTVALHVLAVLAAQHLGLTHLAASHKAKAEAALKINGGDFPALDEEERVMYEKTPLNSAPETPPAKP